ncbi:MAG: DUF3617 domain-containing protein [Bryobacteraceae bacterium]|jgi:hypothetical protein
MKLVFALALVGADLVRAADPTPLNLKAGEWEYSVTMKMTGMPQMPQQMPQIPPDQLAKLPPDQRARIEAAMKNAGNLAAGKPTVNRRCLKEKDLANFNPTHMAKSCKTTVTSSSGSRFEAKVECNDPDNKTTSTIVAEALSAESMKFSMVSSGTANGDPMNMTLNGTGKWLSAVCSDTK